MATAKNSSALSALLSQVQEMQTWQIILTPKNLAVVAQTSTLEKLKPAMCEDAEGNVLLHLKRQFSLDVQSAIALTQSEHDDKERAERMSEIAKEIADGMGTKTTSKEARKKLLNYFTSVQDESLQSQATTLTWRVHDALSKGHDPDRVIPFAVSAIQLGVNNLRNSVEASFELSPYMEKVQEFGQLMRQATDDRERNNRLIASLIKTRLVLPPSPDPVVEEFTASDADNLGQLLKADIGRFVYSEQRGSTLPQGEEIDFQEKEENGEESEEEAGKE